jgi:hypothetical protein
VNWIAASGWVSSLLLVALLVFGLRSERRRHQGPAGRWVWHLGRAAAVLSLFAHALDFGRALVAVTAALVMSGALLVALRRRSRDDRVTLRAANDEGKAVRLRVMSSVIDLAEHRSLQSR